ncbi:adenylate cyclase type 10 isoform X2 [Anser cygnoides]|uniref:adenylate cyclase type 10 isoform X2 n=1 Tax=Anser cygnoides TaxID=8845 RepID=UPI0034D23E33
MLFCASVRAYLRQGKKKTLGHTAAGRVRGVRNSLAVCLLTSLARFTAFSEKCVQQSGADRGADELAQTLNDYMCDILEDVLDFGGDILKFGGDAVLVLWRASEAQLPQTIGLVLQCCQQIQKKHGTRDTHVGVKLQLKIGISAGQMTLLTAGDREQHYFICSQALDEVMEAQSLAVKSEVVLSPTCWELCEQEQIQTKLLGGKRSLKVLRMEHRSGSERQDAAGRFDQHAKMRHLERIRHRRPALIMSSDPTVAARLKKHIPAAALRKMDEDVPLHLWSELRPVTSLFVQLQFSAEASLLDLRRGLSNANRIISAILSPHKGEINKSLLFDKGCTFLCVLGLSGAKLQHESIHALESALQIVSMCSASLRKLEAVSVGVTSGTVFCGLCGHPERAEHTVIGHKVNLAARLMVHYPRLVSCDEATYAASRLPGYFFKELPETKLKGVTNPGHIYQYVGITEKRIFDMGLTKERSDYGPLLGREVEIDLFERSLKAYEALGQPHILAYVGILGSGKSHLLTELAFLGQAARHRVVTVELTEANVRQPFSAIRMLVARALGLQAGETCEDRQRTLQAKLQGAIEESRYCLLNDIFLVKFAIPDKIRKMHDTPRKRELHLTCTQVLQKTLGGEFGIFVIDNAHFIDPASWIIMWPVLQSVTLFMVMSLAPGHERTESFFKAAADSTMSQRISCLHLEELKPAAVVQKACRDLGVVSIPRDLARFLIQRSSGIPYYCEELLRCLRCNNMLLFRTGRQDKEAEDDWEGLVASAVEASHLVSATSSSSAGNNSGRVCTIRPDVSLETTVLPATLKEIALAELDRITLMKQTVLKFAAIIGPVFTTQLLAHILPTCIRQQMNYLLDVLVGDNIIKWLKNTGVPRDVQDAREGPATSQQAGSGAERPSMSEEPTEWRAGVLAFCAPLLREAAYELWPERQRANAQRKCAAFLEKHAHKCRSCHGGDFVAFHRFAVPSPQDGENCQGSADEDDWHSWEALVLAGEQLKKDRTHTPEGSANALQQQQAFSEEELRASERFPPEGEGTTAQPSRTEEKEGGECSCKCEAIIESVLVPLARHYVAIGNAPRAFYYLLECAAAYLHVSNSYMALMKLNEAEALRNSMEKTATALDCFEEATFFSLKGEVCCNLGRVKLAKKMTRRALSLLKKRFPQTRAGAFVKSLWERFQGALCAPNRRTPSLPPEARRKKLAWKLQQTRCLSLLGHLYSLEGTSGGRRFSRLAALMKANTDRRMDSAREEDSHSANCLCIPPLLSVS